MLAVDDLLFVSEQLAIKQVDSIARPAQIVVHVLRLLPNLTDTVLPTDNENSNLWVLISAVLRFATLHVTEFLYG